jgi:hypothetical protein
LKADVFHPPWFNRQKQMMTFRLTGQKSGFRAQERDFRSIADERGQRQDSQAKVFGRHRDRFVQPDLQIRTLAWRTSIGVIEGQSR